MISKLNNLKFTDENNFFLIAGPCAIEDKDLSLNIARNIANICDKLKIPFIFKGSFKKANRSRLDSYTGMGDESALNIIQSIGEELKIPTITDIHSVEDVQKAKKYVDILQIPAFLCRQTDLIIAAAKTNKFINIKKGQFLSANQMQHIIEKIKSTNNNNIMLTERGSMFGYSDLIVDFRSIPIMKKLNYPVILDVTHSLQQPNQEGGITGGNPEMIETIAKAGVACGIDGLFIETHPNPFQAKSDGANMLKLDNLEDLLVKLLKIRKAL
ncbi:3-deoxy-8-phosphooctulonate synthase [Flavobacteriales bacterium]|nr:3-deoxy-8-phosphooctulonate synthase [Flavobacteriales bacterium]|tara:strand:- start:5146 stop:5955 length:810 start_codon:yes stop_codon:yes gene_type:complete